MISHRIINLCNQNMAKYITLYLLKTVEILSQFISKFPIIFCISIMLCDPLATLATDFVIGMNLHAEHLPAGEEGSGVHVGGFDELVDHHRQLHVKLLLHSAVPGIHCNSILVLYSYSLISMEKFFKIKTYEI